jgi:hypothetical protein
MYVWPHTREVGADCARARGGERLGRGSNVEVVVVEAETSRRWSKKKRGDQVVWPWGGAGQDEGDALQRETERESEVFFWVWTARKLAASGPRHPYFGLGRVTVGSMEGVGVPCPSHATRVYQICIFKAHHYYFYVYKLFLTIGSRK